MEAFLRGDHDVLCATTIIEAGLDIPSANTLIVERADLLGLSQLYQIRGRVGRSDVPAHAYLFYPDAGDLTPEAAARLSALADYTELGSGFKVAMRDLELRGAGNLLGDEQSGHVAAVGFELYCELLAEAVAELQGAVAEVAPSQVRVDAAVDAYVPGAYVGLEAAKMDVHRRIALAATVDDLRELEASSRTASAPLPGAGREPHRPAGGADRARAARAGRAVGARATASRSPASRSGPVELRTLRERVPGVLYAGARRELSLRPNVGEPVIETARNLCAGIIEVRSEVGAVAR